MPINRTYSLKELVRDAREYGAAKKEKVIASYMLIDGVNDSKKHAAALGLRLDQDYFDVQLLLYNPSGRSRYNRPKLSQGLAFKRALDRQGYFSWIQISKGWDVNGGCGQFAANQLK